MHGRPQCAVSGCSQRIPCCIDRNSACLLVFDDTCYLVRCIRRTTSLLFQFRRQLDDMCTVVQSNQSHVAVPARGPPAVMLKEQETDVLDKSVERPRPLGCFRAAGDIRRMDRSSTKAQGSHLPLIPPPAAAAGEGDPVLWVLGNKNGRNEPSSLPRFGKYGRGRRHLGALRLSNLCSKVVGGLVHW